MRLRRAAQFCLLALALPWPFPLQAAVTGTGTGTASGTGTIEGRIINPATGEYLATARVSLDGAALETFTDSAGQYRLTHVPAGAARLRVFHTGIVPQTQSVTVAAGQTVTLDFAVASFRGARGAGDPIKLDQFVVAAAKEMSGAAIAINTQRFAANVMTVVAADEFGTIADGNVGEIMKFLPGVTIDYSGGEAAEISINA